MKKLDYRQFIIYMEIAVCAAVLLIYCYRIRTNGTEPEAEPEDSESLRIEDFMEVGTSPADTTDLAPFIQKYAASDETGNDANDATPSQEDSKPQPDNLFWEKAAARNDWRLILVNKQNPVPDHYSMTLVNMNGGMQVDQRIAADLADMLAAARDDHISLMIVSAYRSEERQTRLFNNKVKKYMNRGMSYMDAYAQASFSVTVPGTSEHQLGLALDIVTSGHTSLNEAFGDTEAGKWLNAHAPQYGFILRYPKGKEHITGITYEPWHFRYVGDYAEEITESGLTLEEYLEGLQ